MFSRTVRTSTPRATFGTPRRRGGQNDPEHVVQDFQNIVGNLLGPAFRPGQAGTSGATTLFTQGTPFQGQRFQAGGGGAGPAIVGGRFTYTTGGPMRPGNMDGQPPDLVSYAPPPFPTLDYRRRPRPVGLMASPDEMNSIIGSLFGPAGQQGGGNGMPPGLQNLFAAMLNPVNARSGDAVYSQEALDHIISTLMEQHPASNAPGPASPDAISALPKKKLGEKELGPEGKGECSVCMDDVTIGEEVVFLPCSHWFHEACASAWLSEHNTCPICRKGIEGEATPPPDGRRASQSGPTSRNEHRARRLSTIRPRMDRASSNTSRNEARLESIRNGFRIPQTEPTPDSQRRWQVVGDPTASSGGQQGDDNPPPMPGAFQRRDSEMSANRRSSRRGNTSGSDQSRESRRSSNSGNSGGGGALGWLRNQFGGNRRPD